MSLDLRQQLEAITTEGTRFWDAVERAADLHDTVPSCPDWNIGDLARHLLGVHTAWTEMVAHPAADPVRAFERETESTKLSLDKADLVSLGRETLQRMVDVFGSADQQQPTWTWASQQDVAFITRHQCKRRRCTGGTRHCHGHRRRSDRSRCRGRLHRRVPCQSRRR